MEGYERKLRGCIEDNWIERIGSKALLTFLVNHSAIWGEHSVFILLYMDTMCT